MKAKLLAAALSLLLTGAALAGARLHFAISRAEPRLLAGVNATTFQVSRAQQTAVRVVCRR
jgi:hypothetical protein